MGGWQATCSLEDTTRPLGVLTGQGATAHAEHIRPGAFTLQLTARNANSVSTVSEESRRAVTAPKNWSQTEVGRQEGHLSRRRLLENFAMLLGR